MIISCQVVNLGISTLPTQILTLLVLTLGTISPPPRLEASRGRVGNKLRLYVDIGDPAWSRPHVYAKLEMSEAEEDSMVQWNLMPHRSNKWWWDRYRGIQQKQAGNQPSASSTILSDMVGS
ncbi:uncharacterized protein BDV17DRAFT_255827 [Aspergillus undulatus]|uniref:uncharacterized protein n=1 Tax=Aspergillus undulatus TaxID=1810928 RepID=UPI003CCCDB77